MVASNQDRLPPCERPGSSLTAALHAGYTVQIARLQSKYLKTQDDMFPMSTDAGSVGAAPAYASGIDSSRRIPGRTRFGFAAKQQPLDATVVSRIS